VSLTARIAARPLAVYRLVLGIVVVVRCAEAAGTLAALHAPGTYRVPWVAWMPTSGWPVAVALLALWAMAGAAFAVGLHTRVAGTVAGLAMAAVLLMDAQTYSNHLYLLATLVPLVAWAGAGRALSLDARRGRGAETVVAWPVWLVRTQITAVYLFGALSKISRDFLGGEMIVEALPAALLGAVPVTALEWLLGTSALVVVLAELFVAFGLWMPRHRRDAMSVAVVLHAGMIATLGSARLQIALFAAIMLGSFPLWLDVVPRARTVIWDDGCSACRRWVRAFRALDWLAALELQGSSDPVVLARHAVTRAEADHALQLVGPHGRVSGFGALVAVLEVLPATFLVAPFLRLPGVHRLGDVAYRRHARRRRCTLPAMPPVGQVS
jgi:predicted DCC family thiol-disulfide oxidoreductase YuxK